MPFAEAIHELAAIEWFGSASSKRFQPLLQQRLEFFYASRRWRSAFPWHLPGDRFQFGVQCKLGQPPACELFSPLAWQFRKLGVQLFGFGHTRQSSIGCAS